MKDLIVRHKYLFYNGSDLDSVGRYTLFDGFSKSNDSPLEGMTIANDDHNRRMIEIHHDELYARYNFINNIFFTKILPY